MHSEVDPPASLEALRGCLIGTAVGDAIGLPAEGCSRKRVARRFPRPWRHRFLGSWGMCSDDTEHTFLVVQALLRSEGDAERFRRELAWGLRWWFAALPAGIGKATAKACILLWLGCGPHRAGRKSAGNGPGMRAAILGVVFARDPAARRAFVEVATETTHVDARALHLAVAVAELAGLWTRGEVDPAAARRVLREVSTDAGWQELWASVEQALAEQLDCQGFADRLGLAEGVSGYAYHTAPMVLFAALRYGADPREALEQLWSCGGDTDTTGAILGGLVGARHGEAGFPAEWVAGIRNGPLSMAVLRRAATALHEGSGGPVSWAWPLVPLRNLVFLLIVLGHGLRRLLP